jgi:hypothetical protein
MYSEAEKSDKGEGSSKQVMGDDDGFMDAIEDNAQRMMSQNGSD